MNEDTESYFFNPLNGYTLIKRLTHDINVLQNVSELISVLTTKLNAIKLEEEELEGSVEGIFRLQDMYDLKTEHIARGIIQNKKYGNEMKPLDLLVLGTKIKQFNERYSSEYIQVAKELIINYDTNSRLEFWEDLFHFYNGTNKHKEAEEVVYEILKINSRKAQNEDETDEESHHSEYKNKLLFAAACKGSLQKSAKEQSQLYCRYVSKSDFTRIAPFKVIEVNLNPYVAVYLDVVSDSEIEVLKSIARLSLNRAAVFATNTTTEVSKGRIAQLNWQEDASHEIYAKLTRRVNHMTGLNMETAERWQIQNYGIGSVEFKWTEIEYSCNYF